MANPSDPWPTLHADEKLPKPPLNYAMTLNAVEDQITTSILIKNITYIHGEPIVFWEEEEVETIIIKKIYRFP